MIVSFLKPTPEADVSTTVPVKPAEPSFVNKLCTLRYSFIIMKKNVLTQITLNNLGEEAFGGWNNGSPYSGKGVEA